MHNIKELIQRYLDDSATAEEQAMLMDIIRSGQYKNDIEECIGENVKTEMTERRLMDFTTQAKGEDIFNRVLAGNSLSLYSAEQENLLAGHPEDTAASAKPRYGMILRYAAAVLLLVTAAAVLYSRYFAAPEAAPFANVLPGNMVQVINNGTVIQHLTLYDGSTVLLEPGSEIRYPDKFSAKREVYLSGEAFFEVAHDASHPFVVYSNEVTTRVLGTSFSVKAYEQGREIVVAVKTGKVSVIASAREKDNSRNDVQEVTLTPNLRAVYSRKEQRVVKEIVQDPHIIVQKPVLKNDYANAQIIQILKALGESYGVEIRYNEEELAGCTLTSDVMDEEGLYEQLDVVCNALGGSYTMENATIIIDANGCKEISPKSKPNPKMPMN